VHLAREREGEGRERERGSKREREGAREREGPGDTFSCVTRSPVEAEKPPSPSRSPLSSDFGLGACAGERERAMDVGQVLFG